MNQTITENMLINLIKKKNIQKKKMNTKIVNVHTYIGKWHIGKIICYELNRKYSMNIENLEFSKALRAANVGGLFDYTDCKKKRQYIPKNQNVQLGIVNVKRFKKR